jgi:N6-L-threonylcarbamoyladenine synthase
MTHKDRNAPLLRGDLDFSFSGLKTAVLTAVRRGLPDEQARADLAFEVQAAIVDVLVAKSLAAVRAAALPTLVVAGGVSANARLRALFAKAQAERGLRVCFPEPALCTDNGAMIAFAGALRLQVAALPPPPQQFTVRPRWPLSELAVPRPPDA